MVNHINGMSNGFDKKREHKSEHKDKDRSHKSDHKDKERSKDKERNHKSEHRDKDKDRHKHSSSSVKDKEKHDSSSKDKDRKSSSSSKDKEHKSSSSSSKDKDKDKSKEKDHHHKSSSSSKDKDRHHSSFKDKDGSGKDKDKDSKSKDKHRHSSSLNSSSRDKDKDRNISKDKEKESKKHSSEKDKERHSTSHSSGDKEKHRSSEKDKHRESSSSKDKDKHRHEKEKDRHRHDKDKSKHRDDREKKEKDREETKVKEEVLVKTNHTINEGFHYNLNIKPEPKEAMSLQESMLAEAEDDDDSGGERPLYIKEEDDDEEMKEEDVNLDSTDGNDTRLSDLHNTTLKTEEESEEDKPLQSARSKQSPSVKRKIESDEDEDVPLSTRKKSKKTPSKTKNKKRKHGDDDDSDVEEVQKPKKKNSKTRGEGGSPRKKKQEEEQEVWKWEEEKKTDGTKWHFLEHKGPVFAPSYDRLPPTVKFYYNGKEMKLSEEAEEVATFYARMLDHDYTTKEAFNNNFFHDWREVMTESERARITDLSKCNFKEMHTYFLQKSEERKAMSKEEKQKIKEKNEEIQKEYGFCSIDGHKEKIGNFKIEPPGLFRGRGEHPKMGKLKKRVQPEDVLINCSKDSNIPKPPPGHKWKEVRHDSNVTWLASWTENIQGQVKYIMLNPSSKLKGEKDWQKYETARKLAQSIDKIRAEYREDWKSKEMRIRQRAVALYFIDKLALRAGNEKDEDQADTVGCCSLRVEHIKLHEQKDGREYVVVFDFLGKDSIRYYNEVPVEKRVFKNLQLFMENKSPNDDLFDRLNTTVMNKHLNELMEGLTAKVFRTYNASWTLQQQLDKLTDPNDTEAEKILAYNRANRAVAILCNHQRSVPKTHAKSMENLKVKIETKKEAIAECELQVKDAKRDAKHGSVKEKVVYEKKKKQLERLKEQLTKLEVQATDREENKEIALSTSKLNYLDPRISVAW
ncbi:DNA topoisomerase [Ooceraea biroi]|uniref:DNA topoisomerase I n=1 Tax=Ooceraea biroi TaxID=2015173 RepID=A0A026X5L9_OOCBI|nr:DNA topoisomerase [Ooceraea biroi]